MGKRLTAEERLRRIAYHEAGHAEAAFAHCFEFKGLSIEPEGDTLGRLVTHPDFRPVSSDESEDRRQIEHHIITCLAGPYAERRLAGRFNHRGASKDYDQCVEYSLNWTHSKEEADAFVDWLSVRAKDLLDHPLNWRSVEAIAAALMDRRNLTYAEAADIRQGVMSIP